MDSAYRKSGKVSKTKSRVFASQGSIVPMSAIDIALYGIIALIAGGLAIWFLFHTFSGQTKPPSNLTEETLKGLIDQPDAPRLISQNPLEPYL